MALIVPIISQILWGCLALLPTIQGRSHAIFDHGNRAEVDYSFNESAPIYGLGLHSVPGCPKSIDGYPWVQFAHPTSIPGRGPCSTNFEFEMRQTPCKEENNAKNDSIHNNEKSSPSLSPIHLCHLTGFRGPCPENMLLFYKVDSLLGQCNCDCTNYTLFQENGFCLNPRTGRNIVPILDRCYAIFDQGPCRMGEWLILHPETYSPLCERRRCSPTPNGTVGFTFFHYHRKNCYQTDKVYSDGEAPGVNGGIRFDTVDYDWVPKPTNTLNTLDDNGSRQNGQYLDTETVWSLLEFPGSHHSRVNKGCPQGTSYSQSLRLCLRPFSYFA